MGIFVSITATRLALILARAFQNMGLGKIGEFITNYCLKAAGF
jgi:hypothetical protein